MEAPVVVAQSTPLTVAHGPMMPVVALFGSVVVKVIAPVLGRKSSVAPAVRVPVAVKARVGTPPLGVIFTTPAPAVGTNVPRLSVSVPPAADP